MRDILNSLIPRKPLIICDVDEVVLEFVKPFENYLQGQNLFLKKTSFRIGGNIIDLETGNALSNSAATQKVFDFHSNHVDEQPFADDAINVLKGLSDNFQIVFLTNVAPELTQRRQNQLHGAGLTFPVIQNSGSKAQAAKALHDVAQGPTIFLDDLPNHHIAIKAEIEAITCIHFMVDETFRRMVKLDEEVVLRAESWREIEHLCLQQLT